jgi:uncharacterized glyoxalase superfamily protein PhnB
MSAVRTRASEVEVPADPQTAFAAFTQELDLWWVRGPVNSWDSARVVEMRCEPGVGGRILEVYADDALELARITVWEPGSRLTWKSSLDDVTVEVSFEESSGGTLVRLEAEVAAGGEDRGGSSFVRVAPAWFGRWMERRDRSPRELRDLARLALTLRYERPLAAARWLVDVFGFDSPGPLPEGEDPLRDPEHGHPWLEVHAGGASIMLQPLDGAAPAGAYSTHEPWVFVDEVEAHLAHARDHGATIAEELTSHGFTSYVAVDLEGRRWRFAQARPTQPR